MTERKSHTLLLQPGRRVLKRARTLGTHDATSALAAAAAAAAVGARPLAYGSSGSGSGSALRPKDANIQEHGLPLTTATGADAQQEGFRTDSEKKKEVVETKTKKLDAADLKKALLDRPHKARKLSRTISVGGAGFWSAKQVLHDGIPSEASVLHAIAADDDAKDKDMDGLGALFESSEEEEAEVEARNDAGPAGTESEEAKDAEQDVVTASDLDGTSAAEDQVMKDAPPSTTPAAPTTEPTTTTTTTMTSASLADQFTDLLEGIDFEEAPWSSPEDSRSIPAPASIAASAVPANKQEVVDPVTELDEDEDDDEEFGDTSFLEELQDEDLDAEAFSGSVWRSRTPEIKMAPAAAAGGAAGAAATTTTTTTSSRSGTQHEATQPSKLRVEVTSTDSQPDAAAAAAASTSTSMPPPDAIPPARSAWPATATATARAPVALLPGLSMASGASVSRPSDAALAKAASMMSRSVPPAAAVGPRPHSSAEQLRKGKGKQAERSDEDFGDDADENYDEHEHDHNRDDASFRSESMPPPTAGFALASGRPFAGPSQSALRAAEARLAEINKEWDKENSQAAAAAAPELVEFKQPQKHQPQQHASAVAGPSSSTSATGKPQAAAPVPRPVPPPKAASPQKPPSSAAEAPSTTPQLGSRGGFTTPAAPGRMGLPPRSAPPASAAAGPSQPGTSRANAPPMAQTPMRGATPAASMAARAVQTPAPAPAPPRPVQTPARQPPVRAAPMATPAREPIATPIRAPSAALPSSQFSSAGKSLGGRSGARPPGMSSSPTVARRPKFKTPFKKEADRVTALRAQGTSPSRGASPVTLLHPARPLHLHLPPRPTAARRGRPPCMRSPRRWARRRTRPCSISRRSCRGSRCATTGSGRRSCLHRRRRGAGAPSSAW